MAGSSMTFTETTFGTIQKIKCAWTSDDTTGAVSGATTEAYDGKFVSAITVPGSAGSQPSDQYDIQIVDYSESTTIDLAHNGLADRSNASTQYVAEASMGAVANARLTFSVTNAGNSKTGTIWLFIK